MLGAAFSIYFTNSDEFWFGALQLLPFSLAAMIFIAAVIISRLAYAITFSIYLFMYIQGKYIPGDYGVFNGEEID